MKDKLYLKKYKKIVPIILAVIIGTLYLFNMRLSPMAALKANPSIGKDMEVLTEVELDWGTVYIVDTPESFKTVLVEKHGIFWSSPVNFYCDKEKVAQDRLKTIGYMSYTNNKQKQIQMLGIWNEDPEVAGIHITREDGEIFTKPAPLNELILFQWDELSNVNTMNILGVNQEGAGLYQYGYPEGTNVLRDSEFKWHPMAD